MIPHLKYHATIKGRRLWAVWHSRDAYLWGLDPICYYGNNARDAYYHYMLNHRINNLVPEEHLVGCITRIESELITVRAYSCINSTVDT